MAWLEENWKDSNDFLSSSKEFMSKRIEWKNTIFGDINKRKKRAWARLNGIQQRLAIFPSLNLLKLDKKIKLELEAILNQEELLWFQKSRSDWLGLGDRNTKVSHLATTVKRQKKHIIGLERDDGCWVMDNDYLRAMAVNFYANLYKEDNYLRLKLTSGLFPFIEQHVWQQVTQQVTVDDVKQALFQMSPYKAPGRDNYSAVFY